MLNIIVACSISPIVAAMLCLLLGQKFIKKYSKPLSLIAVGFLITLSVSHIIPEAMEQADTHKIGLTILIGILTLTFFEMLCFNSHAYHEHCQCAKYALKNGGAPILIGSALHTFCDGLVIASAFLANPTLGIAVTVAVVSHEIAHELGDYAIMLDCGMNTKQAFIVNLVALVGCTLGGVLGYYVLSYIKDAIPYALALSGASFVYVSLSDLLPRLKNCESKKRVLLRVLFILIGVVLSLVIASHD